MLEFKTWPRSRAAPWRPCIGSKIVAAGIARRTGTQPSTVLSLRLLMK
jgi:hypothetical protein